MRIKTSPKEDLRSLSCVSNMDPWSKHLEILLANQEAREIGFAGNKFSCGISMREAQIRS
jgi:hypothetical protein